MPVYELLCGQCRKVSEHILAICENDVPVPCPKCGCLLTRDEHRTFTSPVAIQGSTVMKEQKPKKRGK